MLAVCYPLRDNGLQEVKAAAAEALKEMAAYEKQEVGLEEKRKHANSKAKKLKKSLQDVKCLLIFAYETSADRLDCVRTRTPAVMHSVPSKRMRPRRRVKRRKQTSSKKTSRGKKRYWRASAIASKALHYFSSYLIMHSFCPQTRRRYFMSRLSRSRRSFNLGKRKSTRSRLKSTSRPASATCWSKKPRLSSKLARRRRRHSRN